VALELEPATGLYAYSTVLVLVPRQAGKSLLVGVVAEHRALTGRDRRIWYTAQTGDAAAAWLREEHVPLLESVPALGGQWRARMSRGAEAIRWHRPRSTFGVFAPTRDALHGKQSDLALVDEAWTLDGIRGAELLQAIGPTQATRPGAQVWILSAAGDAASVFLADQLAAARASLDDPAPGPVCLVEYGVPDELDATDPDTAAAWHPGVPDLIDPAYLHVERDRLGPDAFARAYGNRFTAARAAVIPADTWAALVVAAGAYPPRPAIGFDVDPDGGSAAVAAAWSAGGRWHVELLDAQPGTGWLPDRLGALHAAYRTPPAYGAGGPALAAADATARAGTPLAPIIGRDWYAACAAFRGHALAGDLAHHGQPALDAAVGAADARRVGDVWSWDRRAPGARLAPLTACTAALWAALHDPGPRPRPVILGSVG
jgi:hypothetical protein